MRKIIIAASMALLFAACGSDDNSFTPTPPTQETVIEVTTDDIVKFLNLDKQLNVYQALEKAKSDLGKKSINGKEVNVTAVSVVKSDEEKGTFTLRVMGNSGGKPFVKDVDYNGFAQKPSDEEMVMRAVASWKKGVDYQSGFDFDTLYRLKDNSKFTATYLQKFVNLSSSDIDGNKHYTFTPADWANTTISDVRYIGGSSSGRIAFTITYKGRKGKTSDNSINGSPSVSFDKNLYYRNQISINTAEASKLYMRGTYEHADVFYTSLLKYDKDKFVPYLKGKYRDNGTNSLRFSINLVAKDGHDTELANFDVTITDFKSLSALNDELTIASSTKVGEFFGKRYRNKTDGDYTAAVKALSPQLWFNNVQMGLTRDGRFIDMYAEKVRSENGNYNVTAWIPNSGIAKYLDIYLLEPRIEVSSAKKTGYFLNITYKITYVNDVAVDGKERTLNVHLIEH